MGIEKLLQLKLTLIAAAIAATLSLPGAPFAQTVGGAFKGMSDSDEPIQIEADNLEVIDNENTALLTGNVSVVQGNTIFKASRIKVFYTRGDDENQTESGIRFIEARGKVAVTAEGNNATADRADIDMVKEIVVMSGNVVMTQGKNVATGCRVTVNLKTSVSNIEPCPNERPTIVFQPKSKQQ